MGVHTITVLVYCDGMYHEPREFTFFGRVLKGDIDRKLRDAGWTRSGEKTYCPQHPKVRGQ